MDYNDQQNANLGVGYTDPEDDDSFIDDSTAAQDNIPKNMTNERDGFYVNEKHQPIQARYVSESSASESDGSGDDDDDSDDDSDSNASGPETEPTEKNKQPGEPIEKVCSLAIKIDHCYSFRRIQRSERSMTMLQRT